MDSSAYTQSEPEIAKDSLAMIRKILSREDLSRSCYANLDSRRDSLASSPEGNEFKPKVGGFPLGLNEPLFIDRQLVTLAPIPDFQRIQDLVIVVTQSQFIHQDLWTVKKILLPR